MAKDDHLTHDRGPEDHSTMADEYPSPETSNANLVDPMDMSTQLANQAAAQAHAQAQAQALAAASSSSSHHAQLENAHDHSTTPEPRQHQHQHHQQQQHHQNHHHHHQQSDRYKQLSNVEQIRLLRDFYMRNPNPSKRDLEVLAERTGRPFNKVREYFRQRRNKLRGLGELECMEEPGRASGWLRVTYRAGPSTSHVDQLSMVHAYKQRFDPYRAVSPLLGGQDIIELACATFPGCEMAKVGDDYQLTGLKEREGGDSDWEKTLEGVAEPVRAATWLLGTYQQNSDTSPIPQTDLYTSYALRFAAPSTENLDNPAPETTQTALTSLQQADDSFELADLDGGQTNLDPELDPQPPIVHHRLLSPVELITLTRMTFPQCEPAVDDDGKFVIRGLERREGVEKGWTDKSQDMFPFALLNEPKASDPDHPLTNLLKRKLSALNPDGSGESTKKSKQEGTGTDGETLAPEDKELLDGLRRFKHSELGKEVREICVSQ